MCGFVWAFAFTWTGGDSKARITTTCAAPTNVHKTGSTDTSISYAWDAGNDATSYKVKYLRQSDGYQSQEWTATTTSFTFSNLSPGRYTFYFASVCGGEASGFIITDDIAGT